MSRVDLRVNGAIRLPEVRLIDKDGQMVGVVSINMALKMAREAELDLVEISPNVRPVVCRICSYSKLKYEEQKKEKENRKKQKVVEMKEIGLSLNIGDSDLNTKIKQTVKFIESGVKVRFNFKFRGREITFSDNANIIIDKVLTTLKDIAKIEEKPKLEGKKLFFTIIPLNK
jgi:translation initiation factor IF-3